ncbi:hypothetical protein EV138_5621 [Kribbella voronezhensis]|uniref:Uncharacterized protein n=1 Tax=Kribbella voronezhensis TaxID=2512212 RepID=A0A4R7SVF9_9ACTN|nr:DUF6339 family protein [Kribbella voronezhensis]TDU83161.1 hypothetical protein EV138_5621 [Kribbella voronezhensis]
MSQKNAGHAPGVLGLLPDSSVTKFLGHGIQSGTESPPLVALLRTATTLPDGEVRWRTGPLRELVDEAMRRFDARRVEADAWLAPRLHATLRMSRAEAADSRRWNYLAMVVAPDYVVWRHRGAVAAAASRFSGPHHTQAFARLWWAAEMFRNGSDYGPVETACRVQDVLNTTLRLDIIDHRPTALAIIRVLERLIADESPRLGDRVNALSSAVNTAGSTLIYDVLAPDVLVDSAALQDWISDSMSMPPVPWARLPFGPEDGEVPNEAVEALLPLFERLLGDSQVRARPRHAAGEDN